MLKDSVTKVTITSAAANPSSLHHLQSFNSENKNRHHLLESSFSSYVDRNGGTFEKKLADSSKNFNSFTSSNREDELVHVGKKKGEDEEIGVFSAEKYFNGGIMEDSPRVSNNMPAARKLPYHHLHPHQKEKEQADVEETIKSKVLSRGTPSSVHSESSWNSQSALLKTALKNSSRNSSRKKVQEKKSLLANLGCKYCSCSDKDSVDVRSTASSGEISFSKNASFRAIHHEKASSPKKSFETVYSGLENQLVNMQLQPESEVVEKPRKSLEVFGSPILESRNKSLSFDKRLTTMPSSSSSWNQHVVAAPKSEEIIDLSANSGGNYINDAASDASSDLFEIESFKGAKSKPYLARQASDAAANSGCVTPTTCYAPSEASIEWSVVTASAAEYSVLSDCDEQRSVANIRSPIRSLSTFGSSTDGKSKADNRDIQRRRSGNLLGCKSHKAVRVAGDAFIRHQKASANVPQVTKMASFDPRQKPRQRSSPSPNASQLQYV